MVLCPWGARWEPCLLGEALCLTCDFSPPLRSSESHKGACPAASMTSEVVENEFEFYSKAEKYWKDVPATVDGMLGGYGHISSIDINSSRKFLQRFLRVGAMA